MKLAIHEIIDNLPKLKSKADKIEWLKKHDSVPLRIILRLTYDKDIEFLIPDSPPPWKKNEYEDQAKALLYSESRRLRIFIKGCGYDNLNRVKREGLFISLLEDIDNSDADLLAHFVIAQKPFKGLTKKVVEETFPDLFSMKLS